MEKIQIFCLPYAGGSKTCYSDWIDKYKNIAKIIPMEYSGHGSRFCESLYSDANDIANDIVKQIISMKPRNYIVYGHSMGSLIALLVVSILEKKYEYIPRAVIFGGTRPPQLKYKDEQLGSLSNDELVKKLFKMGQTESEIFEEPELLEIICNIFRADIIIDEKYPYEDTPVISTPMVVMTGIQDDEAPIEDMKEWSKYATGNFEFKEFNSDHFFPFNCEDFFDYFISIVNKVKNN